MIAPLLDEEAVRAWLADRLPISTQSLSFRRVSAGHSNEMFEIRGGEQRWMLRRPPRVTADPRASNVAREHRVLAALGSTRVPHPRPVALCEDLDVLGVPFMVMEWVDGFGGRPPFPPAFDDPAAVQEMSFALVDVLVDLGEVDWQAIGLETFGRPEGFLERQVTRWLGQLDRYRHRPIAHLDDVAEWLGGHRPERHPTGLMHGDYAPGNVMFAPDRPGRIAAVVDWEQSTVGDPLLDLGWLIALWSQADDDDCDAAESLRLSHLPGAPTRRDLLSRFASRSRLSIERIAYYQVLALFKLAIVLEGSYQRFLAGNSDDPFHATLDRRVPDLLRRASRIATDERA